MHENIVRIKAVNEILKDLKQEFVFVGGATVSLYASDKYRNELKVRPTDDVDVVVELASYGGYSDLDEKLRSIGFKNDVFSGVICRYNYQGIIVDVMPTDPAAIGFSNKWYPEGFETAIIKNLDAQTSVKVFDTPYFMASKMVAFNDRAQDLYSSPDLEDMIFVIEHADDFTGQMRSAPTLVWRDLRDGFEALMKHENFEEAVYAHSDSGYRSNTIEPIIEKLLQSFDLGRSTGNQR